MSDEAPAVGFTNIKTPNGFHWSFTMRCNTVGDLVTQIETMEGIFKTKEWEAEEIRTSYSKASQNAVQRPTRPCSHEGCTGTQTLNSGLSKKTGKPWKAWFCSTDNKDHADFA